MTSMTDQRQLPLACPSWCVIPAEDHERDWTSFEGASHWSESHSAVNDDRPRASVATDTEGRASSAASIFLGDIELTPRQAATLAHQLLATVAMCADVAS